VQLQSRVTTVFLQFLPLIFVVVWTNKDYLTVFVFDLFDPPDRARLFALPV